MEIPLAKKKDVGNDEEKNHEINVKSSGAFYVSAQM